MVEVIVDDRELMLIDNLKCLDCAVTVKRLSIGDVIFNYKGNPDFIIERITVRDLKASIIDGRLQEQRCILLEGFPTSHILYLIEDRMNFDMWDCIG